VGKLTLTRRLLLPSATVIGALSGYGRSAYADCVAGTPPTYTCSGFNDLQQNIPLEDATVTTVLGFSVVTPNIRGISMTGNGALSYTDEYDSTLTAANDALVITADDALGGNDGSITVSTGGALTGGDTGLRAANAGSGAVSITTAGNITATNVNSSGIYATNNGTTLEVTTEAGSTVTGVSFGVRAVNRVGGGATTINTYGNVSGAGDSAIRGVMDFGAGGDLFVTTHGGTIDGGNAVFVTHGVDGNVNVTTGTGLLNASLNDGIFVQKTGGSGDITIITGTGDILGADEAISFTNAGTGSTTINANATTMNGASGDAIFGFQTGDGDVEVITAVGTTLTGSRDGINIQADGDGVVRITANGDVVANNRDGIYVDRLSDVLIEITVGETSTVTTNSGTDHAVRTALGRTHLTVAGTLNGGGTGRAVQFDQALDRDDRLELQTTGVINGLVLAGFGSDTLAFGGTGDGAFDLGAIDTGLNTQQYRSFETFVVESAIWTLDGVTSADFIVNGGTVKGNGTFGSLTVNNGGTLSPGNSFGTVTVNGTFSLNPGAVYEVEVNAAGERDLVVVNGNVNLTGATLRILAAPGDYEFETDYVIIDNDGVDPVNGTFDTVTSTLAFLIPAVAYDGGTGNDVVLRLTRNDVDPCDVAETPNQSETCDAIEEDKSLYDDIIRQTVYGALQAFDTLSGEIHATIAGVLADDNRYVREAILTRLIQASHSDGALSAGGPLVASPQLASLDGQAMALGFDGKSLTDAPMRQPLTFWTGAYGAWGTYDGDGNAATARRDLGGFMSGMDADIGGSWRAGVATGASFSNVDVDARLSSADVESYYLGAYTGGMVGRFVLRGGGTWAWSDIETSRAAVFPGFFERQKASYDADTGQIFGEIAYPTQMGRIALEPFGGIALVSVDTDSFRERGGPEAALRGVDTDQDVGYTTLGLRAATIMQWGAMQVVPNISARWLHAFDDVTPSAALAFATTGAGFTVHGVPLAQDSALLDAGLDFALSDSIAAGVSYSGQFSDTVIDNAVKGRLTWLF